MSTHQASDALSSTMDSLICQCRMDPGRAICSATGRINHDDAGEQLVIRTVMSGHDFSSLSLSSHRR